MIQKFIKVVLLLLASLNFSYKKEAAKNTLIPYEPIIQKLYIAPGYGGIQSFKIDLTTYENKESGVFNFYMFKSFALNDLYYKFILNSETCENKVLTEGVHLANTGYNEINFNVPVTINFNDLNFKGDITIMIKKLEKSNYEEILTFPLTSPNVITCLTNSCDIFYKAILKGDTLEIYQERVTFLNMPKVKDTEYYYYFDSSSIRLTLETYSNYYKYSSATLLFKDEYGYFSKTFPFDNEYKDYRSVILQRLYGSSPINYEFTLSKILYVDPITHMSSVNKSDFQYALSTKYLYLPKAKYEEYQTMDFAILIKNIGSSKTDLFYTFKVNYGNKLAEESSKISRGNPVEKYSSALKEVIL